jgi:ribonuclease HII
MFPLQSSLDDEYRSKGYSLIAGVDEAGRGPLAGPVFAAAVILPPDCGLPLFLDSKSFTPVRRKALYDRILSVALSWHVARVENPVIDEINILQATMKAMVQAVKNLAPTPEFVLVDGNRSPFAQTHSRAVKKGDRLSQSVGAASILAKVQRDRIMAEYHKQWPDYGFDRHKGYGTREHLEAIIRHGPCPIHRRSFRGVREYC